MSINNVVINICTLALFIKDNFGWPGFAGKGASGGQGFGIGGNRGPPPGMVKNPGPSGSWSGSGASAGGQGWIDTPSNMYNQISSCIVLKNLTPQV